MIFSYTPVSRQKTFELEAFYQVMVRQIILLKRTTSYKHFCWTISLHINWWTLTIWHASTKRIMHFSILGDWTFFCCTYTEYATVNANVKPLRSWEGTQEVRGTRDVERHMYKKGNETINSTRGQIYPWNAQSDHEPTKQAYNQPLDEWLRNLRNLRILKVRNFRFRIRKLRRGYNA